MSHRYRVQWTTQDGLLRAEQPTAQEVAACAAQLSADYNEPHNRAMMANEQLMSPRTVVEHWAGLEAQGGRAFVLSCNGELMGDADFRHFGSGAAEFAIMVGSRRSQGKGLGTRFAGMLHVLAFDVFELDRVFVAIIPTNAASLRLFEKLGYCNDDTPEARHFAEEPTDICLSVTRMQFAAGWRRAAPERDFIRCDVR
jgi:RimJ/RimL family protein N-acetyltransferase